MSSCFLLFLPFHLYVLLALVFGLFFLSFCLSFFLSFRLSVSLFLLSFYLFVYLSWFILVSFSASSIIGVIWSHCLELSGVIGLLRAPSVLIDCHLRQHPQSLQCLHSFTMRSVCVLLYRYWKDTYGRDEKRLPAASGLGNPTRSRRTHGLIW